MARTSSLLLLLIFALLPLCSAVAADDEYPVRQNLERAIALFDATIERSFTGSTMLMYDTYDVATHKGSGTADVWPYTAALEAACSILEALDAAQTEQPDLYEANHDRVVALLRKLYDNMIYYKGKYILRSYTQRANWNIYGVHRSSKRNGATVTGIENVYDDQMWICRELVRAYRLTGDVDYLDEATMLADYCIDGWDCCLDASGNEYGGITWGPGYNSKHSCSNGPLIQPLVWLGDIYDTPDEVADLTYRWIATDGSRLKEDRRHSEVYREFARKVYEWQKKHLIKSNGTYYDMMGADGTIKYETVGNVQYRAHVDTGSPGGTAYTYNSGSMLSGAAELYRITGEATFNNDANRLIRATYTTFGTARTIDGITYRQYPIDQVATSGFNTWFDNVLMRAYVDAFDSNDRYATLALTAFQDVLDYGYDHYLTDGCLPIDLLKGWNDATVTKGFHQLAFASEYAMLAVWHQRQKDATSLPSAAHADALSEAPVFDLAGRPVSDPQPGTIVLHSGTKQLTR